MNTLLIVISAIIAFTATLSAGIFIKKFKTNIGIVCALSAGFFIALASFDLLTEILTIAPEAQIPVGELLLSGIVGFVFLFALERIFSMNRINNHAMTKRNLQPRIVAVLILRPKAHCI
jgi:hypothetical protein